MALVEKWPMLGWHEQAAVWLRVWADLGRAPRTMDAYSRGLAEYLEMCDRVRVDPVEADRAHIARYVRELAERPSRRGANVVSIDSGAGIANATPQQRMAPVKFVQRRCCCRSRLCCSSWLMRWWRASMSVGVPSPDSRS
ncbi:integrase [Nocardia sp. NPDC059239]|uniref:integrase n=1 Tax=Nocardia sp. NPDC059239 TaxID=3346785 RepID=UPI00369A149B